MTVRRLVRLFGAFVFVLAPATALHAQAGWVLGEQKISQAAGGFGGYVPTEGHFGEAVAGLGDLDGDGIADLAVAAPWDHDGGTCRGAVWILFLNADGTVKSEQKISDTAGGFGGVLDNFGYFGTGVACLGDHDGDGVVDLGVGEHNDHNGTIYGTGAVWILFLNTDGTVKAEQNISATEGGFGGTLAQFDAFGTSVASLGDLDGDGIGDVAVGAPYTDRVLTDDGAVWILFLNSNGTVKSEQEISASAGGFTGTLDNQDMFGCSMGGIGDHDGDGVEDLAIGAYLDDDGSVSSGAVWLLFLNTNGTVKSHQKISATEGGFGGTFGYSEWFGSGVGSVGDLDEDGVGDLVVGGEYADHAWIVFLNANGTVRDELRIGYQESGFGGMCINSRFGRSVGALGDVDGDGFTDIAIGAWSDDDVRTNSGAAWVVFLQGCPDVDDSFRNPSVGGHTNPAVYSVISPPVLGTTFSVSIGTTGKTGAYLVGYSTPLTFPTNWGNLLVNTNDPNGELLGMPFGVGDPTLIDLLVPDIPALCGFPCATQAMRFGGGALDLTNAHDFVLGR